MAWPAQPAQVLLDERTPQGLGSERTGHVDGQLVVELGRRPRTDLTHGPLQFGRMLTRCNAVGVEAVAVPGQVDGGGRVSAPATDAADTCVSPPLCPENESPGVLGGMPSVVNHQPPQPATCLDMSAGQRPADCPKAGPGRSLSVTAEGFCAASRPIWGTSGTGSRMSRKQRLCGPCLMDAGGNRGTTSATVVVSQPVLGKSGVHLGVLSRVRAPHFVGSVLLTGVV